MRKDLGELGASQKKSLPESKDENLSKLIRLGRSALVKNDFNNAFRYFFKAQYSEGIDDLIVALLRSFMDKDARMLFEKRNNNGGLWE